MSRPCSSTFAGSSPAGILTDAVAVGGDDLPREDQQLVDRDGVVVAHQAEHSVTGGCAGPPDRQSHPFDPRQVPYRSIDDDAGYAQVLVGGGHAVSQGRAAAGAGVDVLHDAHHRGRRLVEEVVVLVPVQGRHVGVVGGQLAGGGVADGHAVPGQHALHAGPHVVEGHAALPLELAPALAGAAGLDDGVEDGGGVELPETFEDFRRYLAHSCLLSRFENRPTSAR